jgi:hypothetical protein
MRRMFALAVICAFCLSGCGGNSRGSSANASNSKARGKSAHVKSKHNKKTTDSKRKG